MAAKKKTARKRARKTTAARAWKPNDTLFQNASASSSFHAGEISFPAIVKTDSTDEETMLSLEITAFRSKDNAHIGIKFGCAGWAEASQWLEGAAHDALLKHALKIDEESRSRSTFAIDEYDFASDIEEGLRELKSFDDASLAALLRRHVRLSEPTPSKENMTERLNAGIELTVNYICALLSV
jgi:hypothetical protein